MNILRKRYKLISTIVIVFFLFTYFSETTLHYVSKVLPFECIQNLKIYRTVGISCPDGWVRVGSIELPFFAFFPQQPTFTEITKSIPHSTETLLYKEYTHENYSLGHVDLPHNWVKWGSNLVFKGTFQQILSHQSGVLKQKRKTLHEQFPAMNYIIQRGDTQTIGRLILVDHTLYKLEVISKKADPILAETFFNTLHLQPR